MVKVWVSKFALTEGIYEQEVEISKNFEHMASYQGADNSIVKVHLYNGTKKKDFHFTREDAVKDAEHRRDLRLKSLEKQLVKLKGMKFA